MKSLLLTGGKESSFLGWNRILARSENTVIPMHQNIVEIQQETAGFGEFIPILKEVLEWSKYCETDMVQRELS